MVSQDVNIQPHKIEGTDIGPAMVSIIIYRPWVNIAAKYKKGVFSRNVADAVNHGFHSGEAIIPLAVRLNMRMAVIDMDDIQFG